MSDFADKFPQSTFWIDGVEIHTTGDKSLPVMWMSDWTRVWEFAARGLLRRENGGPGTYGHVSFYVIR